MNKLVFFLLLALFPILLFAQEKKTGPIKPALIVIDVQKAFVPMVEEREKAIATSMINEYISMFRKRGLSSVGCVLATWFGAKDYDYKAFLLKYSMMSHDSQYTKSIETIFGALEMEAVEAMVQ